MSRNRILAHAGAIALLGLDLIGPTEISNPGIDARRRTHDDLHARAHPPEVKPMAYAPNGAKEIARRKRQIAKGMLKVRP